MTHTAMSLARALSWVLVCALSWACAHNDNDPYTYASAGASHTVQYESLAPVTCRGYRTSATHPAIEVTCTFVQLTSADHTTRATLLRDHLRAGQTPADVTDQAIRGTEEYRSFMAPENVWQWHDQVTPAEALTACRRMLEALYAGQRVHWDSDARTYLDQVRRDRVASGASATPRTRTTSSTSPGTRTTPGYTSVQPQSQLHVHTQRRDSPRTAPDPGSSGQPGMRVMPHVAVDVFRLLDDGWSGHAQLERAARSSPTARVLADRLERALTSADQYLGAITVILGGTTITIAGIPVGTSAAAETTSLTVTAPGSVPANLDLAMELAQPLFEELAIQASEAQTIERALVGAAGVLAGQQALAHLSVAERSELRALLRAPRASLGQAQLERIQTLREQSRAVLDIRPDTTVHKAQRWHDYRSRGGDWDFSRWSTTYDQNQTRAREAHARADRLWQELGWGEREVQVQVRPGVTRVLDIADLTDPTNLRGMEVKSGYVTYSADVAYELERDALLVAERDWIITWHVDGRCSEPLRRAIRSVGIELIETRPDVPIKDLRP